MPDILYLYPQKLLLLTLWIFETKGFEKIRCYQDHSIHSVFLAIEYRSKTCPNCTLVFSSMSIVLLSMLQNY